MEGQAKEITRQSENKSYSLTICNYKYFLRITRLSIFIHVNNDLKKHIKYLNSVCRTSYQNPLHVSYILTLLD